MYSWVKISSQIDLDSRNEVKKFESDRNIPRPHNLQKRKEPLLKVIPR